MNSETKQEIENKIRRLKNALPGQKGNTCVLFELRKSIRNYQAKLRRINKKEHGAG